MTTLVMTSMKMLDGNQITMEMFFYIGKKHQANCNQSEVHSLCAHLWRLGHEGCSEHQGGQEVCQGAGEGRRGGGHVRVLHSWLRQSNEVLEPEE